MTSFHVISSDPYPARKAAKWLGATRVTMREKLNAYGLRSETDSE